MQALDRIVTILELVAGQARPAAPAEVAGQMGLPLSTVARLMRQLDDAGMLYRSADDGRYALGARLFALAGAGLAHVDLAELALPAMRELRDTTGETMSLHVLRGSRRVCVAEVQSNHQVRRVMPPGVTQELCGTATGEVLLAGAPAVDLEAAVERAGLGPRQRKALERRLAEIDERGFAINDHAVENLTGISVPIVEGGRTVAALTASGPTVRFDRRRAERQMPALTAAAERLGSRR